MDSIRDILAARGIRVPADIPTPTSYDPTSKEYLIERAKAANSIDGHLVGYNCPRCKNRGYYAVVVPSTSHEGSWEEISRECSCMPARRELARIKASGLERLGNKCTFRNFKATKQWQKELKERAEEYASTATGSWLFFGGQPGSGKTHICTAIGMDLIKKGAAVRYMVWPDEIPKLKAYVNEISFDSLIAPYKQVAILYIDDFLKTKKGEQISTADVNMAFRIINSRYNAEMITIISSEYSLKQIIELDEALGSRIAEMTDDRYNLFIAPDPKKNYRYGKKGDFI